MIMELGNEKKKEEEESPRYEFKIEQSKWKSLIPQQKHDKKRSKRVKVTLGPKS